MTGGGRGGQFGVLPIRAGETPFLQKGKRPGAGQLMIPPLASPPPPEVPPPSLALLPRQGADRAGVQNARHADGQDGAGLPPGHHPLQPRWAFLYLPTPPGALPPPLSWAQAPSVLTLFGPPLPRCQGALQPRGGGAAAGESLRLARVLLQAEVPGSAGEVTAAGGRGVPVPFGIWGGGERLYPHLCLGSLVGAGGNGQPFV